MRLRVFRTPRAEADLEEILAELDGRNPSVADRFAAEFNVRCATLGDFPEMGRSREELAPGLRSILVKPYVVFYRIRGDVVEVVRILHGQRDLGRLLNQDDPE